MAVRVQATYKLTGWNANQLKLRVPAILTAYDKVIYPQFKEEIQKKQFEWPRETRRYGRLLRATNLRKRAKIMAEQGGRPYTVAGSPRDIVDSGDFMRSQERIRSSATQLTYRWNAPYAALVLTGYETSRGTIVPGRDWIKPALDAIPLDQFFADQWRRLGGSGL
jgi:hypothetical protein